MKPSFHWSHVAALAIGAVGLFAVMTWGPVRDNTDIFRLAKRLHEQTVARAQERLAFHEWRLRVDGPREQEIARLNGVVAAQNRVQHEQASLNRRSLDSLRHVAEARGDILTDRVLLAVGQGVTQQELACDLAVSSCQQAQDSLRHGNQQRDSIIAQRDTSLMRADSLSGDAVHFGEREVRKVKALTVIAAVLGILAIVR